MDSLRGCICRSSSLNSRALLLVAATAVDRRSTLLAIVRATMPAYSSMWGRKCGTICVRRGNLKMIFEIGHHRQVFSGYAGNRWPLTR
jgi:hypothetical protein